MPGKDATIRWPYPALLHLKGEKDLGHYVVLLPSSDRATATIWSGLSGIEQLPAWQLADRIDGGALLISPDPLGPGPDTFPLTIDGLLLRAGWATILLALSIILLLWVVLARFGSTWRSGPRAHPSA